MWEAGAPGTEGGVVAETPDLRARRDENTVNIEAARVLAQEYGDAKPRTSPHAIHALLWAIGGLFIFGWVLGIVAIVMAVRAQADIDDSYGRLEGTNVVLATYVVGVVAFALSFVWLGLAIKAANG
jgi:hypothetical protein